MVARLTPDQKVACSIHVGFKSCEGPNLLLVFLVFVPRTLFFLIHETRTHMLAHFICGTLIHVSWEDYQVSRYIISS